MIRIFQIKANLGIEFGCPVPRNFRQFDVEFAQPLKEQTDTMLDNVVLKDLQRKNSER
ncbi:MAG: hypothetical protein ABJG04_06380 [Roseobacter sp.]